MKKIIYQLTFCTIAIIAIAFNLTTSAHAASPGALDSSFGTAGLVKTNILGTDFLADIQSQSDGKIVAVGGSGVGDFTIVRYLANGTLDTSFNGDGIAFVDFGATESASDVEILNNGDVIVSGNVTGGTGIAKFNSQGVLDTSFGTAGKVTVVVIEARGLAIQLDGKILICGNQNNDFAVVRLTTGGTLDTTFGNASVATTNINGNDSPSEIAVQRDGRIVLAGSSNAAASSAVVRYTTAGALDTTFSGDGIADLNLSPTAADRLLSLTIDPIDSSIGVSGIDFENNGKTMVARLNASGSLDNSFGTAGVVRLDPAISGFGYEIVQQSDKKYIVSTDRSTTVSNSLLFRLNTNGSLDTSFGNNGVATLMHQGGGGNVQLYVQGEKLIVGNGANTSVDLGIERVNLSNQPTQSGDFDGDAFTDSAVYRPSTGNWFILNSSNNTVTIDQFGTNGDIPIDGDFDGDGKSDVAIYRPSQGTWFFKRSSDATILGATFGGAGDRPIPGDYDKDGKTDMAFFRPSNGNWFVLRSSTNFGTFFAYPFGQAGDIPLTIGGL